MFINIKRAKNFWKRDAIVDWLNEYGEEKGYKRDDEFMDYDKTKNFGIFMKDKQDEYKETLESSYQQTLDVKRVDTNDIEKGYKMTKKYIESGADIIMNAVLVDKVNKLYGVCDYLVKETGINSESTYKVIMVKYITIKFTKGGRAKNVGNLAYYKSELTALNEILETMLGTKIEYGYIMGRNNEKVKISNNEDNAIFDKALEWYREMKINGREWETGGVGELYPNMCNKNDFPWHNAKKKIANKLDEITLVWNCGYKKRKEMHDKGIYSYKKMKTDISSEKNKVITQIIDSQVKNVIVSPIVIKNNEYNWKSREYLEFYVDFETISDIFNETPMIFQIGCGYIYEGKWIYKSWIVNELIEKEEGRIVLEWNEYMENIKNTLRVRNEVKVFHWSGAEESIFKKTKQRHNLNIELLWCDMMQIFLKEPITINGCLNFGLKNIARALNKHGLISTTWENTSADGMGVMMCAGQNDNIKNVNLMYDIIKYNEIDCKVMAEILEYLRQNHC